MMLSKVKNTSDLTEGPFFKKVLWFAVPLILTGLLQCFYNAADVAVIGFFRGQQALAAVGSTVSLNNVIVNLFMGFSVGAGVLVAQAVGAKEEETLEKIVHSAILLAGVFGVLVATVGYVLTPWLLRLLDTPETVLHGAVRYMRIIFLGIPALMVYNYGASMVRSSGDSKRPLIFLSISGAVNVLLNVTLVAGFGMGVEGVGIATIVSQYLSAGMILCFLYRGRGLLRFSFSRLRMNRWAMGRMLCIGIPSGIQSSLLSLSNVFLQSSINAFGDAMVAANSAANNLEGFVYVAMNGVAQSAQTFAGQNAGAKKPRNLPKILGISWLYGIGLWVVGCVLLLGFREFFIGLYAPDNPEVLRLAVDRMLVMLPTSFLVTLSTTVTFVLVGLGKSLYCMVISLISYCGFRIFWLMAIYPKIGTPQSLYYAHPISWFFVTILGTVGFFVVYRQLLREQTE